VATFVPFEESPCHVVPSRPDAMPLPILLGQIVHLSSGGSRGESSQGSAVLSIHVLRGS
jgi:hypothetical protein